MILDVWIYALPAEWDALDLPDNSPHDQAITGYWKTFTGGFEVYNVIGTQADIQEIIEALPTPPAHVYSWSQGDGLDNLEQWPTDPADVLAVMNDHITYDTDGNVTDTTAASLDAPNWGHLFYGQKERIFAGDYSNDFSQEYL